MGSAYPIGVLIIIAVVSAVVLPVLWLFLAYWQRKRKLLSLSNVSMMLSLLPVLIFLALYYGKYISAKYSFIFFSVSPFLNILAFIVLFAYTIYKVRSYNGS